MFTDEKFEEMLRLYHGNNLGKGVWSILIIGGPDDDRHFFEKYFQTINEVGREDWHIIGFCVPIDLEKMDLKEIKWKKNEKSFEYATQIISALRSRGFIIPQSCFLFYNPLRTNIYDNLVIYEFDYSKIFEKRYSKALFNSIVKLIRKSTNEDLSHKHKFSSDDYDQIIDNIRESMSADRLKMGARRYFDTVKKLINVE